MVIIVYKIIFNAFKDKTKYLIYTILLFFIIVLFIIILLINEYYNFYKNEIFGSKEENRTLIVKEYDDNIIKELENNVNIEKYSANYNSLEFKNKIENNIEIDSSEENIKINIYNNEEVLKGRNNIKENEVVISQYYFMSSKLTNDDINENKEISLYLDNKLYTFKIIGVTYENKNDIYISRELFEKINTNRSISYNVVVDKYINLNNVINKFEDQGCVVSLYSSHIEIKNINIIQKIFNYILLFSIVIIFIALYYMIKNMFYNEEKNLAVLKSIGYKNNQLSIIIFIRILLVLIFSMIIFIAFFELAKYILGFVLNNTNIMLFIKSINIYKYSVLILIVFLLILILNSLLYKIKIKKMNVFKVLDIE